jgi:hypothetical protein
VTVENVAVTDSATTGLSVIGPGARIRHVTTSGNGMLGLHGNYADDLRRSGTDRASATLFLRMRTMG